MTTGTKVVKRALQHVKAHSPLQPAPPEALEDGKDTLNGMIAMWQDKWGIEMGAVPLNAIGDELSEPLGARNDIEYCLAISLAPMFPGTQVSSELKANAMKGFQNILSTWGEVTIPRKKPRPTLPIGQGNKRGGSLVYTYTFFPEGSELG